MQLTVRCAFTPLLVCLFMFSGPFEANADGGGGLTTTDKDVRIKAWGSKNRDSEKATGTPRGSNTRGQPASKTDSQDDYAERVKVFRSNVEKTIALNEAVTAARAQCAEAADPTTCNPGNYSFMPPDPQIGVETLANVVMEPALTPQQVAYVAAARVQLTPPKPVIGPPPSINQWKMAAVGYPLWLWAEGNLDPAPVTDSVADISVGLDARLVKIVYDMGDGNKVTCTNVSRAWTRDVTPGRPSPACGYAYQKPSLPKGKYTITANAVWAVDWNVNGVTGTIPFYQSATTQLPVGELQVLVH